MPKRRANGEGSIFPRTKDKNGKTTLWAGEYTDNSGTRRTLYGKTQQEVRVKIKAAIRDSDDGVRIDKSKILFSEWMKEWLEVYVKPVVRESTYFCKRNLIYNHIIPAFPNVLLKDINTDSIQRFINDRITTGRLDKIKDPDSGEFMIKQGGLSTTVLYKLRSIIRAALRQAVDSNHIRSNAAEKVKIHKDDKCQEVDVLTLDEQKRLEERIYNDPNPMFFCIILDLYTGLRIGELLSLRIGDVDFEKKELCVRRTRARIQAQNNKSQIVEGEPKTKKSRRAIPLTSFIVDMLQSHVEFRNNLVNCMSECWKKRDGTEWNDEGYIFITSNGTPLEQAFMRITLDRFLNEAGIKHVKFHALRHTFATRCIEAGFDIKSLADILGHKDVKMTLNIYAHSLPEQKRANMEKLMPAFNYDKKTK